MTNLRTQHCHPSSHGQDTPRHGRIERRHSRCRVVIALTLALIQGAALGAPARLPDVLAAPDRPDADRTRDAGAKPEQMLQFMQVREGEWVADIMAGGGYYTELLARIVGPNGRVYMQNPRGMLAYSGNESDLRVADGRLPNVITLITEPGELGLPESKLDLIVLSMIYHDFYYRADGWQPKADEVLRQLYSALKPGGRLIIIDHAAKQGAANAAAQQLHRIEEAFARSDFAAHGFEFVAENEVLRNASDDRSLNVFDPAIRGKTDRFVQLYRRPEARTPEATTAAPSH